MKLPDVLTNISSWLYKHGVSREREATVPVQSGALPWRLKSRKKPEVLLVTGRRSGRWMIPKGWPIPGKSLAFSAAREAFEEAGIEGKVDPQPIGTFRHVKQHILFGELEVDILVHRSRSGGSSPIGLKKANGAANGSLSTRRRRASIPISSGL